MTTFVDGDAVPPATVADASLAYLQGRLNILQQAVGRVVAARRRLGAPGEHALGGMCVSEDQIDRTLASAPTPGHAEVEVRARAACEADADAACASGVDIRLRRLSRTFDLSALDVDLLMVALAPDLDARYERIFGYLHNDLTRRRASFGLAFELCGQPLSDGAARARLSVDAPLGRAGLVSVCDEDRPFPSRALRVPDRVVQFLLGEDEPDPLVSPLVTSAPPCLAGDPHALARAVQAGARLCYVHEGSSGGARSLAVAAFDLLGLPTLTLDLTRLDRQAPVRPVVTAALREARLRSAALVAGPIEDLLACDDGALSALAQPQWPVALCGKGNWEPAWTREIPALADAPALAATERSLSWQTLLTAMVSENGSPGDGSGSALATATATGAAHLQLGAEQIERVAASAWLHAAQRGGVIGLHDVHEGLRAQNAAGLEQHARRREPRVGWDDLVLGDRLVQTLRELVYRARYREEVYASVHAPRRSVSVTAMFTGPPGTGKSMAVEVIAADLGLDVYVVDLARVIDKYIGETEKNLDRVFAEAERVNGVLLFDEADALFGKRSEVRDAHDRYANVETAYLLQRLETFNGLAVLTSNLAQNLDEAFGRRLDLVLDFPMPDAHERRRLWQRALGSLRMTGDVDLDFCATRFRLSGGEIANIAISAAFLAAARREPVGMPDLIRATDREYRKLGRLRTKEEFGPYFTAVP